jgi:hypothetical protein
VFSGEAKDKDNPIPTRSSKTALLSLESFVLFLLMIYADILSRVKDRTNRWSIVQLIVLHVLSTRYFGIKLQIMIFNLVLKDSWCFTSSSN